MYEIVWCFNILLEKIKIIFVKLLLNLVEFIIIKFLMNG